MCDFEKKPLGELLQIKNQLNHFIVSKEFEEKGFKRILQEKNITYHLSYATPLGKNNDNYKKTIGVKKDKYEEIKSKKGILIFGVQNRTSLNEHIFYVFDFSETDISFKDGYTNTFEFINYMLNKKWYENKTDQIFLHTIEEWLNEHKN